LSLQVNPLSIISILTLRYDFTIPSPIPKLNPDDFSKNSISNPEKTVEEIIKNHYIENLEKKSKVGISLSSGIDSTLLLALLRKNIPDLDVDSFSIRFSNSIDETEMAKNIANDLDSTHHIIDVENYFEELPQAISITKLPFWDIHWFYLAKYASSHSNAIISGDGGDELFGGYTFRYNSFLDSITTISSKREKTISYLNCHNRDWIPEQQHMFGENISFDWTKIYSVIDEYFDNSLDSLDQVFLADFNGKLLYNWLQLNPKINSFFKLQSVSPFLDNKMIYFASHIPNELKYNPQQKIGKLILRNILEEFNVKKFVINKKQGFSVDTTNHWNHYGKKLCKNFLVDGEIIKDKLINKNWIMANLEKDLDVRYVNKFYGLLALEIWYRQFISKNMSSSERLFLN
jgi:asparagine synthase (glutamine-hydrolysing)